MDQRRRFTIDADLSTEPIEGSVGRDGGPLREFLGWVGLLQALEELAVADGAARAAGEAAASTGRPEPATT